MIAYFPMKQLTVLPGKPMSQGAIITPYGINFSLFARNATGVVLALFKNANDSAPYTTIKFDPIKNRTGDIWHILIPELKPGDLYLYRVDGPFEPEKGLRYDFSRYLLDPYAKALTEGSIFNFYANSPTRDIDSMFIADRKLPSDISLFPKCVIIDDDAFDWEGDLPINRPLTESIIYEVHLKGFTASPTSGVKNPGTYKGFIEKIPYLKKLGITAVELLPIFEFDENENNNINPKSGKRLTNYWGYSTLGFFAPKCSYAQDKTPGGCVTEFKQLVKECHKAGIEVLLDVVYNHTAEGNENGYTFEFKGIQNDVYYTLWENDKQFYTNYSGCGNTVNCNHPIVANFILASLRYWVMQMHIDGFRFDLASILCRGQNGALMGFPPLTNMISEDPILRNTKIIAEPWDAGGGYQIGSFPGGRWAEWNDRFRDDTRRFIRGDEFTSTAVATRMTGSSDIYLHNGKKPYQSINYVSCHDGFTMNDIVSYNKKHNEENGEEGRDGADYNQSYNHGYEGACTNVKIETLRTRQIKNFMTALLISQGTPMILGGDEFRRTQNGNNNAYCQDNETSWFDWNVCEERHALVEFVTRLIAFRKKHPILSRDHFFAESEEEKKNGVALSWYDQDGRTPDWNHLNRFLAGNLHGSRYRDKDGNPDNDIYIAVNTDKHDINIILPPCQPNCKWVRVLDTSFPEGEEIASEGNEEVLISQCRYVLPAASFVMLMSKSK